MGKRLTLVLAASFVLGLTASGAASARWERAHRVMERASLTLPRVSVQAGRGGRLTLVQRSTRGRVVSRRLIPDSEGAQDAVVATDSAGHAAVAWKTSRSLGLAGEFERCCEVLRLTRFRLGHGIPRPAHFPASHPDQPTDRPMLAVAARSVVAAWARPGGKGFDRQGMDVVAGGLSGPLHRSSPGDAATEPLSAATVRGRAQLAWLTNRGGGSRGASELRVAAAGAGGLGRARTEARATFDDFYGPEYLRSPAGARVLIWVRGRDLLVRSGAPGRALGKTQKLGSTTDWSAALAPDGRTLIAFGQGPNGGGHIKVARGSAGARFANASRLYPRTSTIVWDVAAAIDSAGRGYLVWQNPTRREGNRDLQSRVVGTSGSWGGPFEPVRQLSTLSPTAYCKGPSLAVIVPSRAIAQWVCNLSNSDDNVHQRTRFVP